MTGGKACRPRLAAKLLPAVLPPPLLRRSEPPAGRRLLQL
jgi:hypothetical protein